MWDQFVNKVSKERSASNITALSIELFENNYFL